MDSQLKPDSQAIATKAGMDEQRIAAGYRLCKQLRQSLINTPIIIYSTAALFSEQQEGLRAGATAYLVKPEDLFNAGQIASDLLRHQAARPGIRAA